MPPPMQLCNPCERRTAALRESGGARAVWLQRSAQGQCCHSYHRGGGYCCACHIHRSHNARQGTGRHIHPCCSTALPCCKLRRQCSGAIQKERLGLLWGNTAPGMEAGAARDVGAAEVAAVEVQERTRTDGLESWKLVHTWVRVTAVVKGQALRSRSPLPKPPEHLVEEWTAQVETALCRSYARHQKPKLPLRRAAR